jgi:hypothetical protein
MFRRIQRKFDCETVSIRNSMIDTNFSCSFCSVACCRDNFSFARYHSAQDGFFLFGAEPMAEITCDLAPLHGRNPQTSLPACAEGKNFFNPVCACLIIDVADQCRRVQDIEDRRRRPQKPSSANSRSRSLRRSSIRRSVPDGPPAVHPRISLILRSFTAKVSGSRTMRPPSIRIETRVPGSISSSSRTAAGMTI